MRYINGEQLEDEFVSKIEERIKGIKVNEKCRAEYMVLMTRLQDSREEGIFAAIHYVYPMGYNNSVYIKEYESIRYLNHMVQNLCVKDIDIIITGS